jgi:hypothetical protein
MEVILRLDIAQESRQLFDDEHTLKKDLKMRALGLAAVERSRRRQASRVNWLKAGDACTGFFSPQNECKKKKKIYILTSE